MVLLSGLLGVPAAYALARREFPGKRLVMLLFLLPLMMPPITFGIPLATVLYQAHLAGTHLGRDPRQSGADRALRHPGDDPVHRADRSEASKPPRACSAPEHGRLFLHVLVPLLLPGILAALLLVLVRTIAMFELTFLTAGPTSQTLVVALYYAVFAAGVRAGQSIDAMAVIYMVTTLIWLLIALRFVNPTQIVDEGRSKRRGDAHTALARSRNLNFWILPVLVFGNSSNTMVCGTL